jgi:hypothetical protein
MTDLDQPDPSLRPALLRVTPGLWVGLSLLTGAAPWIVLGVLQVLP